MFCYHQTPVTKSVQNQGLHVHFIFSRSRRRRSSGVLLEDKHVDSRKMFHCFCCRVDLRTYEIIALFILFVAFQCSVSCGDKPGTKYRDVECVYVSYGQQGLVDEAYCAHTPKPAIMKECTVSMCTTWRHGSWGRVSLLFLQSEAI